MIDDVRDIIVRKSVAALLRAISKKNPEFVWIYAENGQS
jgi:3-methyladenine DNA glycosylase AlkC